MLTPLAVQNISDLLVGVAGTNTAGQGIQVTGPSSTTVTIQPDGAGEIQIAPQGDDESSVGVNGNAFNVMYSIGAPPDVDGE